MTVLIVLVLVVLYVWAAAGIGRWLHRRAQVVTTLPSEHHLDASVRGEWGVRVPRMWSVEFTEPERLRALERALNLRRRDDPEYLQLLNARDELGI